MYAETCYLGSCDLENLRVLNDQLNAKVVEQVNDTQELVMLNSYAQETNEYHFKKCLQDRMSDIASWRWVLEDLTKRLTEAVDALHYEHNALRVVISRLQNEIDEHSRDASKPGALSPLSDSVEEAILQEYVFLRDQKKKFERLILSLESQSNSIEKTKRQIAADIFNKERALRVEEGCAKITSGTQFKAPCGRRLKKKRASPVTRWENRCVALKTAGLRALSMAILTRQEVRGARVYLSITAQAYASRVDSALRRRLNTNKVKLQDVYWQKEEVSASNTPVYISRLHYTTKAEDIAEYVRQKTRYAPRVPLLESHRNVNFKAFVTMRDYQALGEEMKVTEQSILETMEQERVVEARLADRTKRPVGEHTRDEVDRQLRDELARLRNFSKQLRTNLESVTTLRNHLTDCMTRIDCCAADILRIVCLDDERISSRLGQPPTEIPKPPPVPACLHIPGPSQPQEQSPRHSHREASLESIKEVDEEDEPYPLDH